MSDKAKRDTAEQKDFRSYCRDWLASNVPASPNFKPLLRASAAFSIMKDPMLEEEQPLS